MARCCLFHTYPPVVPTVFPPEVSATVQMRRGTDGGPADPVYLSPKWVQCIITSREAPNPHLLPSHRYEPHWPYS